MISINDKTDCCGCFACMNICPKNCISMLPGKEGFLYPSVNMQECVDCGLCEKRCPMLDPQHRARTPICIYGCRNADSESLAAASSGGMFELLADAVLSDNGIVFGAGFDKDNNVVHKHIEKTGDIDTLRRSKYVQSAIGATYRQTGEFLKAGRKVLFVGTPCQIAGLRSFLGKDFQNLIAVDFVCHGVPSPAVWQKYLATISDNNHIKIKDINFRNKENGWISFRFCYHKEDPDGKAANVTESRYANPFVRGFLYDLYLRPSCHECKFKHFSSGSDLTLSDFWGVWTNHPEWNDDKGASCIAVNTEKGAAFLKSIDTTKYERTCLSFKQAYVDYNNYALKSASYNPKRELFFRELYDDKPLIPLIMRLTKKPFKQKIKDSISVVAHKLKLHQLMHSYRILR